MSFCTLVSDFVVELFSRLYHGLLNLCQILSDSIFWENLFTGKIYVLPCSSLFGKFCVISKAFLQTSSKSNRFIHGSRHLVFTILKLEPSVSIISGLRSNFWEAQNGRSVMNLVYFGCSAMVTTRVKILDYRLTESPKNALYRVFYSPKLSKIKSWILHCLWVNFLDYSRGITIQVLIIASSARLMI